MTELLARGEIAETQGVFSLGQLVTRLISYFEELSWTWQVFWRSSLSLSDPDTDALYRTRQLFSCLSPLLVFCHPLRRRPGCDHQFTQRAGCRDHIQVFAQVGDKRQGVGKGSKRVDVF